MRIPYGYQIESNEFIICQEKAEVVRMIFNYYLSGASLGKVVDMLSEKESFPTERTLDKSSNRQALVQMQSIFPSLELRHI